MATRSRSVLAPIAALAMALVAACQLTGDSSRSFVPAAMAASKAGRQLVIDDVSTSPTAVALAAAATAPLPVAALEEDVERFDIRILAVLALALAAALALAGRSSMTVSAHWMDHLKFGGSEPSFDVIQKTKEYIAASERNGGLATSFHADDYMFRGSIVGPITGQDIAETQADFNLLGAYPDIDRGIFGYTIDPQNPYRCLLFERWTGTCTGSIKIGSLITLPPTGKRIETPIHVSSITWNPDGKVVYECISPPIDRFEGNTKGSGAVFGLIAGAGLALPAEIGSPFLMFGQRLNTDLLGGLFGKTWSSEEKVATWWKSRAKGADPTDM